MGVLGLLLASLEVPGREVVHVRVELVQPKEALWSEGGKDPCVHPAEPAPYRGHCQTTCIQVRSWIFVSGEGMVDDDGITHRSTPEQVLLNNPLEHHGIALAIPRAVRVDDGDRSTLAHA